MSEDNPAGRFRRTDAPTLLPASDFLTGTTVGPFIDTGVDARNVRAARVYLAFSTIEEMAREAGLFDNFVSKEHHDAVQEDHDTAYRRGYADAMKENLDGRLLAALDELRDLLSPTVGVLDLDVAVESPQNGETPVGAAGAAPGADDEPVEDAGGVDEPAEPAGDAPAEPALASRGKGNGAGRQRRSAGVPGDSSDGANPFRI